MAVSPLTGHRGMTHRNPGEAGLVPGGPEGEEVRAPMRAQDSTSRVSAARAALRKVPLPPRRRMPWWVPGALAFLVIAVPDRYQVPAAVLGLAAYWALAMPMEALQERRRKAGRVVPLLIEGGGCDYDAEIALLQERLDAYDAVWTAIADASPAARAAYEAWASASGGKVFRLPGSGSAV